MGELTIRRNRVGTVPQYQSVTKAEKPAGGTGRRPVSRATVTLSETLQQLISGAGQVRLRESRRTLQAGESLLDEVQDALGRMSELAQRAADGGDADRAALQTELEQLAKDIGRMLRTASAGELRLLPEGAADMQNGGSLAALYLGAVISGGPPDQGTDPAQALDGLRQLMEKVSEGVPLDRAVEQLTGGLFTSLADLQAQVAGGTAPGLSGLLSGLTQSDSADLPLEPLLLTLLAGIEGGSSDLLMDLLSALSSTPSLEAGGQAPQPQAGVPDSAAPVQTQELGTVQTQELGTVQTQELGTVQAQELGTVQAQELGTVQAEGQDLSQISFDTSARELTVGGRSDVTLRGTGPEAPALSITGSGTVTLQDIHAPALTVRSPEAQVFVSGETVLGEVQLAEGASLTLDGAGRISIGTLRGGESSVLRLIGGAVTLNETGGEKADAPKVPILIDGPVSLAALPGRVSGPNGTALEPFDLVWKALLPNWSGITAMELDGRQARTALLEGDPARLWLAKGDHGYPIHTLVLQGRDKSDRPRTRYAYLRWDQRTGAFQETGPGSDPFSVTGGEEGRDWIYEAETHTLRVLSAQVTAISGGADGDRPPFQGRISLADHIGILELTLDGVACQSPFGAAFSLGCWNDVTLLLPCGTDSLFESGEGGAGISLGEGTSLCIDCPESSDGGAPAGTLTASAGEGGAGIGRDSGGSQDQDSHILIRGGVITAVGAGGGAGIGAGQFSAMGPVIIAGGTVTSTGGGGGGAGIGGALGAPAGDISIQGGVITAEALCHAAAIGAGFQGACGDILITEDARILRALGGYPGADIGACLSGSCGKILVSSGADIGGAQLRTRPIAPPEEEAGTDLSQSLLSSEALRLDQLHISTREEAQAARQILDTDRRRVARIQSGYRALRRWLEQGSRTVRDSAEAGALLEDMARSIQLQPGQAARTHSGRGSEDVSQLLR